MKRILWILEARKLEPPVARHDRRQHDLRIPLDTRDQLAGDEVDDVRLSALEHRDARRCVRRADDRKLLDVHGRVVLLEGLELIPRKKTPYGNTTVETLDVEAIFKRYPTVCIIDELPFSNVAGSTYDQDMARAKALGASGYITKPVEFDELKSIVGKASNVRFFQEANGYALRRVA